VTLPTEVQRRIYALMVLMKAADDRLSKGIGTGEFMCVYWPSRGQEAVAAAMGVTLRDDDQLVTTYRGLHDLIGKGVPLEEIYGEMMSARGLRSASGWRWPPNVRDSTG
jgi:TPP-dependent pyruvate/acetoin dehydrogenase alpha subunit